MLKARGFSCVDEAGRSIVQEQLRIGGDATPWQDQMKFRDLLVARYIELFEQVSEASSPVFFDRAIPEAISFSRILKVPIPAHHLAATNDYRYARKVFIAPPWREIYTTDTERRHSFEDGLAQYPFTLEAYRECGYELVEIPKLPIPQRVAFILSHVGAA
jgi:predicted ATPase